MRIPVKLLLACVTAAVCATAGAAPIVTSIPAPIASDETSTRVLLSQAVLVGSRLQELLLTTPPSQRPTDAVMPPGAIPEPPVTALLALGVAGVVALRRRRSK